MKVKRLIALILVFTLFGAATVFADTIFTNYQARKVAVKVNGTSINGLVVDMVPGGSETKTMVPLEDILNSYSGIVSVDDSKGINIYKPNVQMSVTSKDLKAYQYIEYKQGLNLPFRIYAVIDSLETDISFLKINVIDPFGELIETKIESITKEKQDFEIFAFTSRAYEIDMKYTGKYTFELHMKEADGKHYYKVGQIAIYAVSE